MTGDYHSVYLPPADVSPVDRWERDGSVAFVYDIATGPLPSEYDPCDVMYGDLPWRHGFGDYNRRAGIVDGRTYGDFLAAISDLISEASRPTVIVTGRHALSRLPKPAQVADVTMPVMRQAAVVVTYGLTVARDVWDDTDALLRYLAASYGRVGDFCCGYGRAPQAFARAGKAFIASDYNAECIGYIAQHAPKWFRGS